MNFRIRHLSDVPSVANRTNDPRRISSDKSVRGDVLGDYRTCRYDRILAYCYATDEGRSRLRSRRLSQFSPDRDRPDSGLRPDKEVNSCATTTRAVTRFRSRELGRRIRVLCAERGWD